ncbi:MAG: MSHA biogenesis protein MshI [Cellvibrionaceae bacterium]|jgi:MSHA biogenesis protein MshI
MLYAVVVEKTIIVRMIDLVKYVGLSLVAIDIKELSYRNFFCHMVDSQNSMGDTGLAVISIDRNEGRLLILKEENILLSRNFSINYGAGIFDYIPEDEIILELQRSLDYHERQMR